MKKSIFLISIIVIGISYYGCRNSKTGTVVTDMTPQRTGNDSINGYQPDEREREYTHNGVFDIPELYVAQSPAKSTAVRLAESESVIAYDVSPAGLIVAAIIKDSNKNSIKLWKIDQNNFFESIAVPDSINPTAIVWHPQATAFFIAAENKDKHTIIRYEKKSTTWSSEVIYSTKSAIKRIIMCPRPFLTYYDNLLSKSLYSYRLFFGLLKEDGTYRIASVTEFGKKFYQVIGPASSFTHSESDDVDPSQLEADWALPVAFHPSGQNLIWENKQGEFFTSRYDSRYWGEKSSVINAPLKGGQIAPIPSGLGLLHWTKDVPGVNLCLFARGKEEQFLQNKTFKAAPVSTPDGRGVICLSQVGDRQLLEYNVMEYPQSDVANSWMFAESEGDIDLLARNSGIFRTTNYDQLYQLYESENYYCNSYDQSTPTRPYFVTTDIFWELFGSAFQGIFTVRERAQAIPAFWKFVNSANTFYSEKHSDSQWAAVFSVLVKLEKNDLSTPEVKNIMNSGGSVYSEILKKEYNYAQLKPLGIYSSSNQMQLYYRAFKYLTTVFGNNKSIVSQLNNLPADIKNSAFEWISSYSEFVSKPRRQNVFAKEKFSPPEYVELADTGLSVFPLSWGIDNEILNSVVYHSGYPKDKLIISSNGEPRLHPSGLDLAAAISGNFAGSLMEEEYRQYPNLRPVIQNLRKKFDSNISSPSNTLYDRWIDALAKQWIDTVKPTTRELGNKIWQTKRLQTGLASWATLRHATVLVNETSAAECGEGGFEEILMRAPRGYVEPDPYTLEAIAKLFESAIEYLPKAEASPGNSSASKSDYINVSKGIANRMRETADEIRYFGKMAEKEIKGESITNEEYEAILHVARTAEHNFLIFKSLANPEYALALPDPMPKITNVFGDPKTSYLMAAVGRPLEWDFVVPYFGRKQIVKGSVYSYYEFVNDNLLDDGEWIKKLPSQEFLPWVKPFVSDKELSYPPKCGL